MKRIIVMAMAIGAWGAVGPSALSLAQSDAPQAGQQEPHHRHHRLFGGILKHLNLTDDEKAKVHEVFAERGDSLRDLRKEMEEARKSGDKDQLKALFGQMKTEKEALATAIGAVLTTEQNSQFQQLLKAQEEARAARFAAWQQKRQESGEATSTPTAE
jgi:Spy/CpxP family protein refolding chaperone